MEICYEDEVWKNIDPDHIWVLDKFILSRKLEYICGPVGMDVPEDNRYIVRPCKNALGLGIGTSLEYLQAVDCGTDHLTPGYFWCEVFKGRHFSVDYQWGKIKLVVEGFKKEDTFVRWDRWEQVDDLPAIERIISFPKILNPIKEKYEWINCEFIGSRLIEVHLRKNNDFQWGNTSFIPVWEGEDINPPNGYRYIEYPDIHGRIGAYVRIQT